MNALSPSRKLILAIGFIIVITLATITFILNQKNNPEAVTKEVLQKTYSAQSKDYDKLNAAITQSSENNNNILDYLHSIYGDLLTENGYKVFINNRIPAIAVNIAHEENSDLKVVSIDLEPEDALKGSRRYIFSIQAQTDKNKSYEFKGDITVIKENGHWKVDGATPNNSGKLN